VDGGGGGIGGGGWSCVTYGEGGGGAEIPSCAIEGAKGGC